MTRIAKNKVISILNLALRKWGICTYTILKLHGLKKDDASNHINWWKSI